MGHNSLGIYCDGPGMRTAVDTPRSMEREPSHWMEYGLLEPTQYCVRESRANTDAMTQATCIGSLRAVVRWLAGPLYPRFPMQLSYVLAGFPSAVYQHVTTATCIVLDFIAASTESVTLSPMKARRARHGAMGDVQYCSRNDHNGAHGATTIHSHLEGVLSVLRAYSSNQSTLVANEHTRTEGAKFGLAV